MRTVVSFVSLAGAFSVFFSLFRSKVIRADVFDGISEDSGHEFPTTEGFTYSSLGSFEDTPDRSRVLRFSLPSPLTSVDIEGLGSLSIRSPFNDTTSEYYPILGDKEAGYFDLLTWNVLPEDTEKDINLTKHRVGDEIIARKGKQALNFKPLSYDNLVLFIDPTGVPLTLLLVRHLAELKKLHPKLPNLYITYFKPNSWPLRTSLDNLLYSRLQALQTTGDLKTGTRCTVSTRLVNERPLQSASSTIQTFNDKTQSRTLFVAYATRCVIEALTQEYVYLVETSSTTKLTPQSRDQPLTRSDFRSVQTLSASLLDIPGGNQ